MLAQVLHIGNNYISPQRLCKAGKKGNIMQVFNTTIKTVVTLSIIDPASGCCWARDLIGNNDGFGAQEHQFLSADKYTGDDDLLGADFAAGGDICDWWEKLISQIEKAENRLYRAKNEATEAQREELFAGAPYNDVEDMPAAIMALIDDVMGAEFE